MSNRFKTTWRHPRSKHWHLLDYAIIHQPDRKDVLVTRTKPSADDCWTDHRLLITRLRISIRSKPKVNHHLPSRKKFDVSKLHHPTIHDEYEKTIHEKLITNPIDPLSVEEEWKTIRNTISESAKAIFGFTKRKIDENDQEISRLIDAKRLARLALENDPRSPLKKSRYQDLKRKCQTMLREIQNNWWQQKASEL